YDLADRLIGLADALGSRSLLYNNQGRVVQVNNPSGQQEWGAIYDVKDRATSITEPNGVTLTYTYDNLNRVVTRSHALSPEPERFAYSARGLISYKDQLLKETLYEYDVAGRRTKVTTPNVPAEVIEFTYSPAGDLVLLKDGKEHLTSWIYDAFGNVITKKDHNNLTVAQYVY